MPDETASRHCKDGRHVGARDVLDKGCPGCRVRLLVLRDREDAATQHDVQRGPCKCGAWH